MDAETRGRFNDVGCVVLMIFILLLVVIIYTGAMVKDLRSRVEDLENNCQCVEEVLKGD